MALLRNIQRAAARISLAVATAAIAACSSTGGPLGLSPAQEQAIGVQEHPKIVAAFGGDLQDPDVTAYVERVTRRLIAAGDQPDAPIKITVLDSPVVNAMALPGHVYVTRGLLALANSEAELAGVMGHELGHVYQRHTAKRVSRGNLASIGAAAVGILTGQQDTAQLAGQAAQLYVLRYGRQQEYEADQIGVRLLARAGYDPIAEAYFLNTLGRWTDLEARIAGVQSRPPEFLSSHPNSAERVRRAAEEAQVLTEAGGARGETGRKPYLGVIDGLVFGDDPARQGYIQGQRFTHPGLGLTFSVPNGFQMRNTSSAVIATSQSTGAQMQFAFANGEGSPSDIISGPLAQSLKIQFSSVRQGAVNGKSAAVGFGALSTQQGRVDIAAYVIKWDGATNYMFLWATPPNQTRNLARAIQSSVETFAEVDAARLNVPPTRRVEVVPVRRGATVSGVANGMAFPSHKQDRFRVLNGLGAQDGLRASDDVKIIR
ncbi:MAG: M48 family metalloprotease [Pseudomonadota bacterium]